MSRKPGGCSDTLFNPTDSLRRTAPAAIKWAWHDPVRLDIGWSACKTATTLSVLVQGQFPDGVPELIFRYADVQTVLLERPGQYVIFPCMWMRHKLDRSRSILISDRALAISCW